MQKVACPSCGAEVSFRSVASVMAVCEYCLSTLLKDAESVKDIGKMAQVLEDYSPIQVNTTGEQHGRRFTVVGRIQLTYDSGFWNEWYVLFDDGNGAWLSDASGQYVFTSAQPAPANLPAFEALRPGISLTMAGARFTAADVRTAKCVAGQGELPFQVGQGWQTRTADFRSGKRFVTLDYSEGQAPQVYVGESVDLTGLRCQLLRSDEDIARTAGGYRGRTSTLSCPNCGSPIKYRAGMATNAVCGACHAQIDCSTDTAVVLQKQEQIERVLTTLSLGDTGTIDGVKCEVIGFTKCREIDSDESSQWVEYLLFSERRGFLWLVEADGRWDRIKVLDEWPEQRSATAVALRGEVYNKLYQYGAEVIYAAGAFNWRVAVGDRVRIVDYARDGAKLTAESSDTEIVWSSASQVPADQVRQWFGKKPLGLDLPPERETGRFGFDTDLATLRRASIIATIVLVVINLPLEFRHDDDEFLVSIIGGLVLWIPFWLRNKLAGGSGDSSSGGDD